MTAARPINPMLIDGQVHGGVVYGIGQALYERVALRRRRASSSPARSSTTRCPRRPSCPASRPTARRRPSPVNSIGVKGVGEAGTIAASAAVTNAVIDALRPLGVDYINMPLSPMRVWEAITEAKGGAA